MSERTSIMMLRSSMSMSRPISIIIRWTASARRPSPSHTLSLHSVYSWMARGVIVVFVVVGAGGISAGNLLGVVVVGWTVVVEGFVRTGGIVMAGVVCHGEVRVKERRMKRREEVVRGEERQRGSQLRWRESLNLISN